MTCVMPAAGYVPDARPVVPIPRVRLCVAPALWGDASGAALRREHEKSRRLSPPGLPPSG
ncbi:hypothetical protein CHELA20_53825 [Hyphomicrobiales bacterium]|nr:hypothetical protein CHELA41_21102 [Hyphomicrobiales bacterium]CAH1685024.1 hypothetical protein CHELA20_53825 [Hyphomicrobiales bacterium]